MDKGQEFECYCGHCGVEFPAFVAPGVPMPSTIMCIECGMSAAFPIYLHDEKLSEMKK